MRKSDYQVIITLAGTGKRFSDAGYKLPKYLLPISKDKCVLDLVIEMYDGMDILLVCNENHMDTYNLVNRFSNKKIHLIGVTPKEGPGYAIWQARNLVNRKKKIIVQYCDTFQNMNLKKILKRLSKSKAKAGIFVTDEKCPSVYDGTLYGRVRVDNDNKTVIEIQEKAQDNYSKYLGCGTFYFESGDYMLNVIETQVLHPEKYYLNNEAYLNCTMNVVNDKKDLIEAINITGYINLGVPIDYEEFMSRKRRYDSLTNRQKHWTLPSSTLLIPAVGEGSRFKSYGIPKPFIKVNEKLMCEMAKEYAFPTEDTIIAVRKNLNGYDKFVKYSKKHDIKLVTFDSITEGQALTILESLNDVSSFDTIALNSCDQGILYDENKFYEIFPDADIIVCGIRNYQKGLQNPSAYSWIESDDNGNVTKISTKKCNGDPRNSLLFVSCLLYKNKGIIENSVIHMLDREAKINGEYYIDESLNDAISLGYKVKVLEIDSYLNWGTPEELEQAIWWNRFFKEVRL